MVSRPIPIPSEHLRQLALGLGIDHGCTTPPGMSPGPKESSSAAATDTVASTEGSEAGADKESGDGGWPGNDVAALGVSKPSTAHQLSLAAQWLLYETFTCYAPLVSLIYWGFLYSSSGGFDEAIDTWMGTSMHATNTALMLLEVLLFSRCPYRWTHFAVVMGVLASYLVLVYFMVGVYDFYVYPFFDARFFGGYVAVICLLVVDVVGLVWVVLLMVHSWRDRKYPKWIRQ
ncbi:hypothetical protein FBU59_005569 [Linderina macrospora]|uniref:Uncharacterized protein n=1 Tax=Linderina macrospora TaxID=4868 RepID=A0ACC1J2B0_9FUNG|nr:hypothetical protein FBU59_005569 [Linderina macrospora]